MGERSGLGEFEQLVMLAILRVGARAYAAEVAEELDRAVGRSVTRGALYSTLNRLEGKGLVSWAAESPDSVRSGHVRRRFSVTAPGVEALRQQRETLLTLWSGVESVLDGGS